MKKMSRAITTAPTAPATLMVIIFAFVRPCWGAGVGEEVGEGVGEEVGVKVCVDSRTVALVAMGVVKTKEFGTPVSQHGTQIWFEQTQSLSQSSYDAHESPRQCPSHVHVACVVEGAATYSMVSEAWDIVADIFGEGDL
jgi:hypothetical protein